MPTVDPKYIADAIYTDMPVHLTVDFYVIYKEEDEYENVLPPPSGEAMNGMYKLAALHGAKLLGLFMDYQAPLLEDLPETFEKQFVGYADNEVAFVRTLINDSSSMTDEECYKEWLGFYSFHYDEIELETRSAFFKKCA